MKTFKDLEFKKHPVPLHFDTQAVMKFKNNYGVSVVTGNSAYTDNIDIYEVAILYDGELCYTTDITDDVLGYQSEEDITEVMKRVQNL